MDVGLGPPIFSARMNRTSTVLILVLVDVGLGQRKMFTTALGSERRLNPCFSGCWSRTIPGTMLKSNLRVLILVLVDVGLGPH